MVLSVSKAPFFVDITRSIPTFWCHFCLRLHRIDFYIYIQKVSFFAMVTSSYCSIYTRYIDYTSLPFKRNENDIANKNIYKTNHYQHWIRIEPSKQPYLFLCLWYTKYFILWMRRINVIGYTNLFRICFYTICYDKLCPPTWYEIGGWYIPWSNDIYIRIQKHSYYVW